MSKTSLKSNIPSVLSVCDGNKNTFCRLTLIAQNNKILVIILFTCAQTSTPDVLCILCSRYGYFTRIQVDVQCS